MGKIEEDLKKINAEIDAAADKALQAAERSKFTGVWGLLAIVAVLGIVLWALLR